MNDGLLDFIGVWLSNAWTLLTSVNIPGTNMTPGIVLIGVFVAVFGLRLLGRVFGFSFQSDIRAISGYAQGGGNNKNIKVDEKRKDDKH